jgi:hypothetical protein
MRLRESANHLSVGGKIHRSPPGQREILQDRNQNWESGKFYNRGMREGIWYTLADRL